jgi:hypothetical protein
MMYLLLLEWIFDQELTKIIFVSFFPLPPDNYRDFGHPLKERDTMRLSVYYPPLGGGGAKRRRRREKLSCFLSNTFFHGE